jgi:enoyl-CoA hydratase/carnithine racemase
MTMSDCSRLVSYVRDDSNVGRITLERPQKLNAINRDVMRGLVAAFEAFHADDGAKAAVLAGAGSSFCVGADIVEVPASVHEVDAISDLRRLPDLFLLRDTFKPIVTATHGHVLGAGLRLALLSDFIVCAESTTFRVPEIDHGLDGSPYWILLQHRAGDAFATDVVATGRSWTAAEAVQRGVVTELVSSRELLPAAVALASRLAARPTAALAALIETRRTRLRWAELEAWTTRGRGLGWSADRSVS